MCGCLRLVACSRSGSGWGPMRPDTPAQWPASLAPLGLTALDVTSPSSWPCPLPQAACTSEFFLLFFGFQANPDASTLAGQWRGHQGSLSIYLLPLESALSTAGVSTAITLEETDTLSEGWRSLSGRTQLHRNK